MSVNFSYPTVQQLINGVGRCFSIKLVRDQGLTAFSAIAGLPPALNAFSINGSSETVYWVIQNEGPVGHPIHLHLHDFSIISQGAGAFDPDTSSVNWINPTRRDVAFIPPSGHLFIAFKVRELRPGRVLMRSDEL